MSINQSLPRPKLHWNNFNLSYSHDTTGRFGNLIPIQVMEVVPGDIMKENIEFNIRLSPLSAPAMVRLNAHFHAFYVPFRILTPRSGQETTWEKFITSLGKPLNEVVELPHFVADGEVHFRRDDDRPNEDVYAYVQDMAKGSLWDYMRLPVIPAQEDVTLSFSGERSISALPHLALLKIYNDWYRRDQIEEEIVFPLDLGRIDLTSIYDSMWSAPENTTSGHWESLPYFVHELMKIRSRNYERDYFTSGLPEPQYGEDVVVGGDIVAANGASIALSSISDIALGLRGNVNQGAQDLLAQEALWYKVNQSLAVPEYKLGINGVTANATFAVPYGVADSIQANVRDVEGLSHQTTVNELRMAFQLQGVRERINRGGTRYAEIMQNVYGVSINDLRLQRPQYLGGVKSPLTIGAVIQTSESKDTPQGTLTGQGGAVGGNVLFHTKHVFDEHGLVVVFMSITPRTSYIGGVPRMFRKFDPIDYYCQAFDHLGEQTTKVWELYEDLTDDDAERYTQDFCYNSRYEEYKAAYGCSTGEFRDTLSNWVLTRSFNDAPGLSPDFIHADSTDFDRLFMFENIERTSNEHFQAQVYFDLKAKRPMSKYSIPFTFY